MVSSQSKLAFVYVNRLPNRFMKFARPNELKKFFYMVQKLECGVKFRYKESLVRTLSNRLVDKSHLINSCVCRF